MAVALSPSAVSIAETPRSLLDAQRLALSTLDWVRFNLHTGIAERNSQITDLVKAGATTHEWGNLGWFTGSNGTTKGSVYWQDDGELDSIIQLNDNTFTGTLIFAWWFRLSEATNNFEYYWSYGSNDNPGYQLRAGTYHGDLQVSIKVDNVNAFSFTTASIGTEFTADTPTPVVLVLDHTAAQVAATLYVNGVETDAGAYTRPTADYASPKTGHYFGIGATFQTGSASAILGSTGAQSDGGTTVTDHRMSDLEIIRSTVDLSAILPQYINEFGQRRTDLARVPA